jgi:hypothetical protein
MVSAERLRLVEADQARSRAYRWGEDGLAGVSAEGLRTGGRGAIKSAAAGRRTGAGR